MAIKILLAFSCLLGFSVFIQITSAEECTCSNLDKEQLSAERSASQQKWQKSFDRFAQQDESVPVRPGGTVFVGSSSIRLWDLEKYFPATEALNRGFGGSQTVDACFALELLVLKHKPKTVVLYAGDNDIAKKKSPQRVADDFARLAEKVHQHLPKTRILYIAIKPSIRRWELADKMNQANQLVKKLCAKHTHLTFVDIWQPMLNDGGKPNPELFVKDGLHMSPAGYAIWTKAVKAHLKSTD